MRALHCHLFMTLDGVVENPGAWSMAYWNDDIAALMAAATGSADAMVLGRVGYQEFAAAWGPLTEEQAPGADFFNGVRKHVASRTLSPADLTWNGSVLLEGDAVEAVAALKAEEGGEIITSGSPGFVRQLLAAGLVDELHLLVHPVLRGSGRRLGEGEELLGLELVSSEALAGGVLSSVYRLAD